MKNVEPSGRFFQVQKTLGPAEARAISRRARFEGEASADEAYSPGSRQRRCAGEQSVEARHIVPHHPTSAQNMQIMVRNPPNGDDPYGHS